MLFRISEVLWSRKGGMKKGDIAFLHTKTPYANKGKAARCPKDYHEPNNEPPEVTPISSRKRRSSTSF
jgi:hypothetical protein